ncbi:E3 ubiquitin-protein ligase TRAIP isoform X2 [Microcaecilia unicolor]|uniref:E3 ubiquitin-protein ligase TRAIP isoform X2 n=1 Tax=Microcaecilia unicolor TaxID=1415580 RepID=A0A6P7YEG5_9AMPH|nr:E3 ubiquitin-protein ligase TRAIP isoform X2 [Microcaecilia unicolor]
MPIRAYCTICSDFFDNSRDVAAVNCGHTFHYECLFHWFHTAPSRTCPQCRIQVSTRQIINKLYFDIGGEEDITLDAESLKNELDRTRAQLSVKEKEKRDCQSIVDSLRESLDIRNATIESLQKELGDAEMLCSTLKKQMKYMEHQQTEAKAAQEETRRMRTKMKTMENLELLLQGQRTEVEQMIRDMGMGQSAMEQLATYCISLKKEYENLKETQKASHEMTEKLKKEVFVSNNKLKKTVLELNKTKEELTDSEKDLRKADQEISLKKKIEFLQKTLSAPTQTNEAISRLVFESPAPVELQQPRLHLPANSGERDLNITFDFETPDHVSSKSTITPIKRICLAKTEHPVTNPAEDTLKDSKIKNWTVSQNDDDEVLPAFIKNSLLKSKFFGSIMDPHRNKGAVRMGYDGLGGRTKFIQPTNITEIRPFPPKMKRRKVSRPAPVASSSSTSFQPRLDDFLK